MSQLSFSVAEFLNIIFPSTSSALDDARSWAARNILDYHGLDVIAVSVDLAAQIRNADAQGNTFYIQSVTPSPGTRYHFLWRASEWRDSREYRRQLLLRIAATDRERRALEAEQEAFRTKSADELAYRKAFVRWLDDFAVRVCEHAPGFKPAWFKQSCRTIASKLNYDPIAVRDWLYEALADEQIIKDLFTGYPERKQTETQHEHVEESNPDRTQPSVEGQGAGQEVGQLSEVDRHIGGESLAAGSAPGTEDRGSDCADRQADEGSVHDTDEVATECFRGRDGGAEGEGCVVDGTGEVEQP